MKLSSLPSEFQKALPILRKIQEAGFQAYFVGGCVRDVLLDHPIHDVDIASSAYPQEIKDLFERTVDVGIEHGTVLVLEGGQEYEITTFRTEEEYVDYRRPSQVHFVRSLEEDLKRRDFTINALALDAEGNLVDLFHGLEDLETELIRAVGLAQERFQEDALRIMRGFRFQASLDFDLEAETFQAMIAGAPLLEKIAIERIFIEFEKLLLANSWARGLSSLLAAKAYHYLPGFASESQALSSFLEKIRSDFSFTSSAQAWAAMLYYFENKQVAPILRAWKTSRDFQKQVLEMVEILRKREQGLLSAWDCYSYQEELLYQAEELRAAMKMETNSQYLADTIAGLAIRDKQEIVVTGRTLMQEEGFQPGPQMGHVLKEVELAIVKGELTNEKGAILAFVKERLHD
ncbi:CCA tRNA nucleotidyltransferase [Streptococcus sp. NLN76]|uniref:CCA tRNA nucleotidyltransferase n=1 Tax=Streptococcus sp. NLN76 TaxID=2822800 RepID=UPI0018A9473D|nr:CCA tRNA nucleotidyltransferase [Streptococcus sp. NLN76]MBF8969731.1 CCA tRNA nucleotidyltransferase [Streptococcus sp. NLN76]